jgi:hypothetical protein
VEGAKTGFPVLIGLRRDVSSRSIVRVLDGKTGLGGLRGAAAIRRRLVVVGRDGPDGLNGGQRVGSSTAGGRKSSWWQCYKTFFLRHCR